MNRVYSSYFEFIHLVHKVSFPTAGSRWGDELSPTFHVALNVENLFRDYVSDVTFVVEFKLLIHSENWFPGDDVSSSRVPVFHIEGVSSFGHESFLVIVLPQL